MTKDLIETRIFSTQTTAISSVELITPANIFSAEENNIEALFVYLNSLKIFWRSGLKISWKQFCEDRELETFLPRRADNEPLWSDDETRMEFAKAEQSASGVRQVKNVWKILLRMICAWFRRVPQPQAMTQILATLPLLNN